jgi:hypothetical protein
MEEINTGIESSAASGLENTAGRTSSFGPVIVDPTNPRYPELNAAKLEGNSGRWHTV